MRPDGRWKQLSRTASVLAAAGICLSPVLAQQLAPHVLPRPIALTQAEGQARADKEVILTAGRNFRAVVLREDGRLVPGARIIFRAGKEGIGPGVLVETGPGGHVLVTEIRPGLYKVRVEARECCCEGTLLVKEFDGDALPVRHVVAFTLPCDCGRLIAFCPRLGAGLAAGMSAALAATLAAEKGRQPPVASP